MRDLIGLPINYAKDLPPEPKSLSGFLNNGQNLLMSPVQMETYLQVAKRALDLSFFQTIIDGILSLFHRSRNRNARKTKRSKLPPAKRKTRILPNSLPRAFP